MVGSGILRKLVSEGFKNIVTRTHGELDLLDQRLVEDFFKRERPEIVFLAAARVGGILANMRNQAIFLYENLQIQNNVMWAASRNGTKKFIFLGSSCIYPRECPQPIKEDYFLTGPFEPTNEGYAIAKIAGLKLCGHLSRDGMWSGMSVIPCNLYGPGDNFDSINSHVMAGLVKRFTDAADFGADSVVCWGTGAPRREFLHVDDLARAIFMLLESNPYGSEPINVGYGRDVSIAELACIVAEKSGFDGEILWDVNKPDGMRRKLMDSSKIKQLGFVPKIALESGIESLIMEYRRTRDLSGSEPNE
jgi:GDP-L-fucose synthase